MPSTTTIQSSTEEEKTTCRGRRISLIRRDVNPQPEGAARVMVLKEQEVEEVFSIAVSTNLTENISHTTHCHTISFKDFTDCNN